MEFPLFPNGTLYSFNCWLIRNTIITARNQLSDAGLITIISESGKKVPTKYWLEYRVNFSHTNSSSKNIDVINKPDLCVKNSDTTEDTTSYYNKDIDKEKRIEKESTLLHGKELLEKAKTNAMMMEAFRKQLNAKFPGQITDSHYENTLQGYVGWFDSKHINGESLLKFSTWFSYYLQDIRKLPEVNGGQQQPGKPLSYNMPLRPAVQPNSRYKSPDQLGI